MTAVFTKFQSLITLTKNKVSAMYVSGFERLSTRKKYDLDGDVRLDPGTPEKHDEIVKKL